MARKTTEPNLEAADAAGLNRRAWALLDDDPRAALQLAEEARQLAVARGDALEQARSLRTIGGSHNLLYDYVQAERCLAEGLTLIGEQDAPELRLELLVLFCRVDYSLGNYRAVLDRGAEALTLARSLERRAEQAVTLNVMGHTYRVLGLYTEALEYYQASLSLFEEQGDRRRTHPLSGIATVYEHLGNHAQALAYYQATLGLEESQGQERDEAITRSCLGNLHLSQGDQARAEELLQESLAVFEKHGDPYNTAAVLLKLGDLHRSKDDVEGALAAYGRVLEAEHAANPWHQAIARLGMSRVQRGLGDAQQALHHARAALELVAAQGARAVSFEIHHELSELLCQEGDYAGALEHYRAFHELKEEVMGQEIQSVRQALMIQFDTERAKAEREIYRLKNVELARANEELRAMHQEVERLSLEDALTELHNRRSFNQRLAEEYQRARRYGRTMTLMLGDLDNFKHVNDNHSHAVGDQVLQVVAEIIRQNVRGTDIVARYGGEEFVVIFPETSLEKAVDICEILRMKIEKHPWHSFHPDLRVTISIGLADSGQPGHEAMLELADKRMYEAKRMGKNRVSY